MGGLCTVYVKMNETQISTTYIDQSCCELGERVLGEMAKNFVQALVESLLNSVSLDITAQVICHQRMIYHIFFSNY